MKRSSIVFNFVNMNLNLKNNRNGIYRKCYLSLSLWQMKLNLDIVNCFNLVMCFVLIMVNLSVRIYIIRLLFCYFWPWMS